MVRVEVRCPQPPRFPGSRSGSLVLDLHNIHLSPGGLSGDGPAPRARFAGLDASRDASQFASQRAPRSLFLLEIGRIVVAHSLVSEGKAYVLVSLSSLSPVPIPPGVVATGFGRISPTSGDQGLTSSAVSMSISRTTSKYPQQQKPGALVVATDVQSVYVNLNKPLLDGLQYWVDDVSQLTERTFGDRPRDSASERGLSRNSSLLGSHFFAQSSGGSEAEFPPKPAGEGASETVVKLSVSEGL